MKMTNRGNQIIYKVWAPFYDMLAGRIYQSGRRQVLAKLNLQPGENLLLVGVGTGVDLPYIPADVQATGVDLSPDMLRKAEAKRPLSPAEITLLEADATQMPLDDNTFDAAVLNLILAVVPDPVACWQETLRVLKPGGRLVIFDKFVPEDGQVSGFRRLLNQVTMLIGTDINRKFSDIVGETAVTIFSDEPSMFGGQYRVIVVQSAPEFPLGDPNEQRISH
jgi:phosphatidylethanolamine/phosphatidyl-N-methylethanolamine N-methyltransferase